MNLLSNYPSILKSQITSYVTNFHDIQFGYSSSLSSSCMAYPQGCGENEQDFTTIQLPLKQASIGVGARQGESGVVVVVHGRGVRGPSQVNQWGEYMGG
jgi:hypothetical protein